MFGFAKITDNMQQFGIEDANYLLTIVSFAMLLTGQNNNSYKFLPSAFVRFERRR